MRILTPTSYKYYYLKLLQAVQPYSGVVWDASDQNALSTFLTTAPLTIINIKQLKGIFPELREFQRDRNMIKITFSYKILYLELKPFSKK